MAPGQYLDAERRHRQLTAASPAWRRAPAETVEVDFTVAPGFGGTQAVNFAEISAYFNSGTLNDMDSMPGNGASKTQ